MELEDSRHAAAYLASLLQPSLGSAEKSEEGSKMKNVGRALFSTLGSVALAAAVWALLPTTVHSVATPGLSSSQTASAEQSVSGKISSVEKASFTLTVGQSQTSIESRDLQQDPASPKTMSFMLDKNTTIEGSLKVGATADVTYRQEKGSNVAISVRVTP